MFRDFFIYLIYTCFVMYGWQASLVGSVWPKMSEDIGAGIILIGILTMVNYISSGILSFSAYKIRMKLGTSRSNVLGLMLAAISMLILANATSFVAIVIATVFLGASAGIIDVNSNSYVVKAYETKWVSFMHACWGLGATIGPMVMSFALVYLKNYRFGFYISFVMMLIISALMLFAKKYWDNKKITLDKEYVELHSVTEEEKEANVGFADILKIKNALKILICFMLANGAGCSLSAWVATMATEQRGVAVAEAAIASSIFFFALMLGRIVFGMLADKIGISKTLLICMFLTMVSVICYYIPYKSLAVVYAHSAIIGFSSGALIPLLNSNLKELFDTKYLSPLISFGGVFGLCGIAAGSAIMTLVANALSIHHVQIVQIISFIILFVLYGSVVKNK